MRIALVAGETSGDHLGAGLVTALRAQYPHALFYGIGGPLMIKAGVESLYEMNDISMIGLEGLFTDLPRIIKIRRKLRSRLIKDRPDVFIGIDVPDFNLGLEKQLTQNNIRCIHYVSPTIWAWRGYRIKKIKQSIAHMLVLFPFEVAIYKKQNIPVTFVGHPIADEVDAVMGQLECREGFGLATDATIIALLPGSRRSEITRHARLFLESALQLSKLKPEIIFLISAVNEPAKQYISNLISSSFSSLKVQLISGQIRNVISASDIVLAASGTVTLETALLYKPLVMAYKVSKISELMFKYFALVEHYAMPNFLLDSPDVPEYVQQQATVENLSKALLDYYLDENKRIEISNKFKLMKIELKANANKKASQVVGSFLTPGCK